MGVNSDASSAGSHPLACDSIVLTMAMPCAGENVSRDGSGWPSSQLVGLSLPEVRLPDAKGRGHLSGHGPRRQGGVLLPATRSVSGHPVDGLPGPLPGPNPAAAATPPQPAAGRVEKRVVAPCL